MSKVIVQETSWRTLVDVRRVSLLSDLLALLLLAVTRRRGLGRSLLRGLGALGGFGGGLGGGGSRGFAGSGSGFRGHCEMCLDDQVARGVLRWK